jgi:hypothetical protein
LGSSVTSDAVEMVPTGGELALVEAVDRGGLTSFVVSLVAGRDVPAWVERSVAAPEASRVRRLSSSTARRTGLGLMIVLGADMHKSSHAIAGIAAATGEMLGDRTARVGTRGFGEVLLWARGLGADRVCDRSRRACGPGPDAADG